MSSVPTNSEILDQLRRNATAPAEASNETGSVKQHPLKDQVEAAKFAQSQSVANPFKCLRMTRTAPGPPSGAGC